MEQPSVSRFNSSSTSRTLVGSDNGIISPIYSQPLSLDSKLGASPGFHTPDSKQWVDLDALSPKLASELLRYQYNPSEKADSNGAIAKSAAKLKTWVRRSKLGIDIRLRRKLDAEHDEVTDIHLVPNSTTTEPVSLFETSMPSISELPGAQHEISELPDSSVAQELDAGHLPSRASTDSSIGEPLPRYEPRREPGPLLEPANDDSRNNSPPLNQTTSHRPTLSQSSIVETPTRGLSLSGHDDVRFPGIDFEGHGAAATKDAPGDNVNAETGAKQLRNALDQAKQQLRNDLDQAKRQLDKERQCSVQLQDIIKALQPDIGKDTEPSKTSTPADEASQNANAQVNKLRVENKTTYETETDAEPPSPSQRRLPKPIRKKMVSAPKRKRSVAKSNIVPSTAGRSPGGLENNDHEIQGGLLHRKPTGPTRLPSGVDTEAIWASLLRLQAKIIGPEHPLAYQAKSDLARSRANDHTLNSRDLIALRESKDLATGTLGIVHPWVSAFVEDLATLEKLVEVKAELAFSPKAGAEAVARSLSGPSQQCVPGDDIDASSPSQRTPQLVIPAQAANAPLSTTSSPQSPQLKMNSNSLSAEKRHSPISPEQRDPGSNGLWDSSRPPHKPGKDSLVLPRLILDTLLEASINGISWLQQNYGPEQPVQPGQVRVRWTCSCGEQLYDDFVERRQGAARELEAYLNRPRMATGGGGTPTSPSSSQGSNNFSNSSFGGPPSSQTSWSSYGYAGNGSMGSNGDTKPPGVSTGTSLYPAYNPFPEPPWLLTCANEDRFTPKLAHLDMAPHRIRTDKDLALSLRDHYFHLNKKWWRLFRLRGLTTIQFVQFEVHQNRFADVRKCPDMPAAPGGEYEFEPGDLLPPVGSKYLLHLFRHPEDYDGERITYLRAPKKHGRLQIGRGWGINLVEGVLLDRIWLTVSAFFAFGSLVFVIAWATTRQDVQGASGVAAWMVSLAVLLVGWLQTFLG